MKASVITTFIVLLLLCTIEDVYGSGEIDKIAVVSWVIDGDTFDIEDSERIRLADIDTPEEEPDINAYWAAKNYTIEKIYDKTVYLDVDDKYTYDAEGQGTRLVCVVYVDYNQTHYLNVNKDLLVAGYAELKDYDNEFNPNNWSLYVLKEEIPELSSIMLVSVFVIMTSVTILVGKKERKN